MKHGRGYVYDLYYHIVWCVKYRHKILLNDIKDDLIDIIKNICVNNNYELVEINTDLDHVHLLIGLSPQDSIPVVMKTLKGVSARLLNSKHKNELSKVLNG
ncbi:MAG: IS200/IS605 family transposase, partial [Acholeplasmatales bacterium]|nr:IS200/IS605 family transposase [Acholeplasmatales bacterium]